MYYDIEPLAILLLWITCVTIAINKRCYSQIWVIMEVITEIAAEVTAEVTAEVLTEATGGLGYRLQI